MKVLTIAGTRPELIRLCVIIEKLDKLVDHTFVYTNQNYDYNLSGLFFEELKIRKPDYYFIGESKSFSKFMSSAFEQFEDILIKERPDKILILGDTNSGLLALVARKFNIPVYHCEAGNRCYDDRVPEESNRRVIDALSTYNLPYTENSKQNLLREGYDKNHVFKIGNPIYEVLTKFRHEIYLSDIEQKLGIEGEKFVLVTAHRAENVDNLKTLKSIITALNCISKQFKVIFSIHPRTRDKIEKYNIVFSDNIVMSRPLGFFDFVNLEKSAKVVISDSGTLVEECCIFNVPSITIRRTTERQETIECGSNILSGVEFRDIITSFKAVINRQNTWTPPQDYMKPDVADTVVNILLGK